MKFQLGDRVELTGAAKAMFPRLALAKGAIAGRLPKADYLPFRVCWDTKSHHESYSAELLQLVSDAITAPLLQHEALMAAAKDIFAAEKELNSRWVSLMALRRTIYPRANALRAAGVIEGTKP